MTDPVRALRSHIGLAEPGAVEFSREEEARTGGVVRYAVEYEGLEGDRIPAILFVPERGKPVGGVVAFHQHNGEFHLGKSEVAGDEGEGLQAFGPALARRGLAVLAPDAISFEERRAKGTGTTPEPGEDDWLQHYNAMAYRLVDGDTLMRKALDDAQRAVSVLLAQPETDPARVGVMGHSYGGTTALYPAALDARCRFACVSGALASMRERRRRGTGLNVFEVVPGIATLLDADDLLRAITPRPVFVVSASRDPYAIDADAIVARVGANSVSELRVDGEHALDENRFAAILDWVTATASPG